MSRLIVLPLVLLIAGFWNSDAVGSTGWGKFKAHFISGDGRVIDFVNDRISTSEGQSYAMILAAEHNDHQTFELVWKWTKDNLQVRDSDKLLAWKWGERLPGKWDVVDLNNATDGDILAAFALFRGAEAWGKDEYRIDALALVKSIHDKLIIKKWDRLYVLPGYYGFHRDNSIVLNPSYLVVSAFKKFAQYDREDFWNRVYRDSFSVISNSLFGKYGLPADWTVQRQEAVEINSDRSSHFAYESIRVLLYLSWDGNIDKLTGLRKYLEFVGRIGFLPCCVNLTENSMSLSEASGGFYAVFARAAHDYGMKDLGKELWSKSSEKIVYEKDDYYSNVLYLLSKIDIKL